MKKLSLYFTLCFAALFSDAYEDQKAEELRQERNREEDRIQQQKLEDARLQRKREEDRIYQRKLDDERWDRAHGR